MSAADSRPPEMPDTASDSKSDVSATADSNRPALKKPPRRPDKPAVAVEETKPVIKPIEEQQLIALKKANVPEPESVESAAIESVETVDVVSDSESESNESSEPESNELETAQPRLQPIAPPSEPMQYRAIGLLKGRYQPSEETFNRGSISNHDGSNTAAVLLGRTTSLVKKHLDLEKEHLWVVYPRTIFQDDIGIAVQIVGVWEPETLGDESDETVEAPVDAIQPDYFSIRGEVVKYDERKQEITVSIVQKMRTGKQPKRPFKLLINGNISVKTIGYFWDMHVQREGNQFVLTDGSYVGAVPPKKRSKKKFAPPNGNKRKPAKRSSRPKPNLAKEDGVKPEKPESSVDNSDEQPIEQPDMVKVGNGSTSTPDLDDAQD